MNCQYCKIQMKPLFSGFFCPNDCDRKCQRPPEDWQCSRSPGHDGPCAATKKVPELAAGTFRKSYLWKNTGPRLWTVCCPYCDLSGYGDVDVIMRPSLALPQDEYEAVCRGKFAHKMIIVDDSPSP